MKLLIVSNSPWRDDNSFGNSYSNIFAGMENIEIANIYCKYGRPNSAEASKFFQITEMSLIKNRLKGTPSGKEVFLDSSDITVSDEGEKIFNSVKKHKGLWMYWARAIIWKFGKWKSKELIEFIDEFQPDLLFIPLYYSHYLHDINEFILKHCRIPAVGYVSDDIYTLKQYSLSPFFWIDRILMRRKIRKVFSWCEIIYAISDIQKNEYEKIFGNKFKILTKCLDFSDDKKLEFKVSNPPLKLLYAGNISKGRYRSLLKIAEDIEELNRQGLKYEFNIFTATPLTEKKKEKLNLKGVYLHPPIPYSQVREWQKKSDILVHVEGFDLRERLITHQSFSTKIVDYLEAYRCIFAVGDVSCASIDYFTRYGCGVVAASPEEIGIRLKEMYTNPDLLLQKAEIAWKCGKKYHQRTTVQTELYEDLEDVCARIS